MDEEAEEPAGAVQQRQEEAEALDRWFENSSHFERFEKFIAILEVVNLYQGYKNEI